MEVPTKVEKWTNRILYGITGLIVFAPFLSAIGIGIYSRVETDCDKLSAWLIVHGLCFIIQLFLFGKLLYISYSENYSSSQYKINAGFRLLIVMDILFILFNFAWIIVGGTQLHGRKERCELAYGYAIAEIILGFFTLIGGTVPMLFSEQWWNLMDDFFDCLD